MNSMNSRAFFSTSLILLALLATAPAFAEGPTTPPPPPPPAVVLDPDQAISAQVDAALKADTKLVGATPITVSTKNGIVSLSGSLQSVGMVYRAIEIARRVEGVKKVDDAALIARAW